MDWKNCSFSKICSAIIVGGGIGVRIRCELPIVLFKINENMQKIANNK